MAYFDLRNITMIEIADAIKEKVRQADATPVLTVPEKQAESYHVIPRRGEWAVKQSGNKRATRVLNSQKEAISYVQKMAETGPSREIVIHKKDGSISRRMVLQKKTR